MLVCLIPFEATYPAAKTPNQKALPAKAVFYKSRLKKIDVLLKQAIAREALPSAVCYVAYAGKPVYYKAFGTAYRENNKLLRRDAIFRNASQTKLVTTIALMTLYEQGLFKLDDPVKKYLPEFSNPVVRVSGSVAQDNLVTRPAKGDITIRQLLSHNSGLSYDPFDQDVKVINYAEPITTEEAVRRIARLPLQHDPGMGFTYGFSLDVAGRLAEVISGMRLDSLIKKRVLDPLDMKDTYFYLPPKKWNRLVPLYQKPKPDAMITLASDSVDRFYPLNQSSQYFGGGGGLCGTIKDYANLCQMILDKGLFHKRRILSRKTVEQMCTDQLFGSSGDYKFGFGLEIATDETFARTMKAPGSLRWGGYYGTEYLIDPQNDLVILLYTNKVSWYLDDVWDDFFHAVYMSLK